MCRPGAVDPVRHLDEPAVLLMLEEVAERPEAGEIHARPHEDDEVITVAGPNHDDATSNVLPSMSTSVPTTVFGPATSAACVSVVA